MWPFGKKNKTADPSPSASPSAPSSSPPSAPPAAPRAFLMECSAEIQGQKLPIFPILMPESWERAPTQVCRPIIKGPTLPNIPVVALAYLIPTPGSDALSRAYIRTERVEALGKTVADFEREALHNLSCRNATWDMQNPTGSGNIAMASGDYLTAERILDRAFMQKAHEKLGDDAIMVGIPARGQLYATKMEHFARGEKHAIAFKMMVESAFQQAGDIGITPWMFILIKGQLNSIAEFG